MKPLPCLTLCALLAMAATMPAARVAAAAGDEPVPPPMVAETVPAATAKADVAPAAVTDADAAPSPNPDAGNLGTTDGAALYAQICRGCHMADGRGATGGGSYPSLAGNPNLASPAFVAAVVLHGRRNMPAFAPEHAPAPFFEPVWLTDAQVASVVNHVRTHFGNHHVDPITAAQVAALHPPAQGE